MTRPWFEAVLFDLLSGLLDSWSLWDDVAGRVDLGRRWRRRCLERCSSLGAYLPYEGLVAAAAADLGLPPAAARALVDRWAEAAPWPEVSEVLGRLAPARLGVVTNCDETLARRAAASVGASFSVVVSAERAGAYKPDPRPYRLAVRELEVDPRRVMYVAGSPFDVVGASAAGLPVYWHNRLGVHDPAAAAAAATVAGDLRGVPAMAATGVAR